MANSLESGIERSGAQRLAVGESGCRVVTLRPHTARQQQRQEQPGAVLHGFGPASRAA
ncbi:MAG: hypothetical protein AW07_03653 [Candidatus Accumulibacter sp. SK-11]|nr:MAG: hypothetical protein AW07_03653 [Candidatus Accumulibacter sp. SK-11]